MNFCKNPHATSTNVIYMMSIHLGEIIVEILDLWNFCFHIPNPPMRHIFILPCPWTCSFFALKLIPAEARTRVVKIKKLFEKLSSLRRYIEGERAILHHVYHTRVSFAYTLLRPRSVVDWRRRFCDFQTFTISQKSFSSSLTRFRIRNWWKVFDNFNENWRVLGDEKKVSTEFVMSNWHNLWSYSFIAFRFCRNSSNLFEIVDNACLQKDLSFLPPPFLVATKQRKKFSFARSHKDHDCNSESKHNII